MKKKSEKEVYEIENIAKNEGCLVSIIKYVTLFIIGFILLWIIVLRFFRELGFEYGTFFSFLISISLSGYFIYRILNHSNEVYKLIFNDKEQELTVISGNTFDGIDTENKIQYESIIVTFEEKPIFKSKIQLDKDTQIRDDYLSQNRKMKIYNLEKFVGEINIDLSGWCRHDEIDKILDKLKGISNEK